MLYQFSKEGNIAGMSKANPVAYKSYMNNIEKLNDNLNKVDAYTNEIQRAKEKLYQDQRNVENLNNLNRLNVRLFILLSYHLLIRPFDRKKI